MEMRIASARANMPIDWSLLTQHHEPVLIVHGRPDWPGGAVAYFWAYCLHQQTRQEITWQYGAK